MNAAPAFVRYHHYLVTLEWRTDSVVAMGWKIVHIKPSLRNGVDCCTYPWLFRGDTAVRIMDVRESNVLLNHDQKLF